MKELKEWLAMVGYALGCVFSLALLLWILLAIFSLAGWL